MSDKTTESASPCSPIQEIEARLLIPRQGLIDMKELVDKQSKLLAVYEDHFKGLVRNIQLMRDEVIGITKE